jgi:hypothetical protein
MYVLSVCDGSDGSCEKQGLASSRISTQRAGKNAHFFMQDEMQLSLDIQNSAHDSNMQLSPFSMTAICSSAHNTDMGVAKSRIPACDLANDITCNSTYLHHELKCLPRFARFKATPLFNLRGCTAVAVLD